MGRDKTGYLLLWHRDITFITRLVCTFASLLFFFLFSFNQICLSEAVLFLM